MIYSLAKQEDLEWKKEVVDWLEFSMNCYLNAKEEKYLNSWKAQVEMWSEQLERVKNKLIHHDYTKDELFIKAEWDKYQKIERCKCDYCK